MHCARINIYYWYFNTLGPYHSLHKPRLDSELGKADDCSRAPDNPENPIFTGYDHLKKLQICFIICQCAYAFQYELTYQGP